MPVVPARLQGRPDDLPATAALGPLWQLFVVLGGAAALLAAAIAWFAPADRGGQPMPVLTYGDSTAGSGLTWPALSHRQRSEGARLIGGFVGVIDYDQDGRPDLFAIDADGNCALFHNEGNGRFRDATADSGIKLDFPAISAAIGDFDGDGLPGIFVTGIGGSRLFRNLGGGKFKDITARAKVGGDDHVWSTGAVWLDIFGDGRLDLVVCNYARWPRETDFDTALSGERAGPSYGAPAPGFTSCFPTVYRNLGRGHFVDVTSHSGLEQIDRRTGFPRAFPLSVAPVDVNHDGDLGLLFTYQSGEDVLFLNSGGGVFREWRPPPTRREGVSAGLAGGGNESLLHATQDNDRFTVLREAGLCLAPVGENELTCPLRDKLGVAVIDAKLDGRLEIVSGDGALAADPGRSEPDEGALPMPRMEWRDGKVWKAGKLAIGPLARDGWVRGIAVADFFGQGRPDMVVASADAPLRLLRDNDRSRNAWLRIQLVGTRSARDAGGARVDVQTPRRTYEQTVEPAMGYMAQSEGVLTFGLGNDTRVNRIVIRWPSGIRQAVPTPDVNRQLVITEPAGG